MAVGGLREYLMRALMPQQSKGGVSTMPIPQEDMSMYRQAIDPVQIREMQAKILLDKATQRLKDEARSNIDGLLFGSTPTEASMMGILGEEEPVQDINIPPLAEDVIGLSDIEELRKMYQGDAIMPESDLYQGEDVVSPESERLQEVETPQGRRWIMTPPETTIPENKGLPPHRLGVNDLVSKPYSTSEGVKPEDYATADEYVKAQGESVYHGTNEEFNSFKLGKTTGAQGRTSKQGIWFTDSKEEAIQYAKLAGKRNYQNQEQYDKKIEKLISKSETAADKGDYDTQEKLLAEAEALEIEMKSIEPKEIIVESFLPKNMLTYDSVTLFNSDEMDNVIEKAKKEGYDGVAFTNISDSPFGLAKPTNQYVVFNPKHIKTEAQLRREWEDAQKTKSIKSELPPQKLGQVSTDTSDKIDENDLDDSTVGMVENLTDKVAEVEGKAVGSNMKTYKSINLTNICPKKLEGKPCEYCYIEYHRETGDLLAKPLIAKNNYNGELLRFRQDTVDKLNDMAGIRIFNSGDYIRKQQHGQVSRILDDAKTRGLLVKGITKVPEFVEDFHDHPAISVINVSIDTSGSGVNWDIAKELRNKYPKVRIRSVAKNPQEARMFGDMEWVDVITLYHGKSKKLKEKGYIDMPHSSDAFKEIAKKYPNKVCCQTGKCATCPIKCGL